MRSNAGALESGDLHRFLLSSSKPRPNRAELCHSAPTSRQQLSRPPEVYERFVDITEN
jgi:hypothetical protein